MIVNPNLIMNDINLNYFENDAYHSANNNTDSSEKPAWMNDPLVKNIPRRKLDFLGKLFLESKGKNQKQMMAYIMPMMKKAKAEKLTFNQGEINACIQAIKNHSTKEELENIDKILKKKGLSVNVNF